MFKPGRILWRQRVEWNGLLDGTRMNRTRLCLTKAIFALLLRRRGRRSMKFISVVRAIKNWIFVEMTKDRFKRRIVNGLFLLATRWTSRDNGVGVHASTDIRSKVELWIKIARVFIFYFYSTRTKRILFWNLNFHNILLLFLKFKISLEESTL